LVQRAGVTPEDCCFYLDTTHEPKTGIVDEYVRQIKERGVPGVVVGIGGGATMDVAKAVAIMLANPGKTHQYQGWDLVVNKPVYKIGVPTLSGTGAEVSRTTVLIGPEKKQGINSDFSLFDQIVLDPDLLATVPSEQRFYTAMDCYIHGVEALCGTFLNEFSRAYAEKALELCRRVFLHDADDALLMVASFLGGYSIVYSEVGLCHALSYGLSYAFGAPHGQANCLTFKHLHEYYPAYVPEFQEIAGRAGISLEGKLVQGVSESVMEKMIDITLLMEKPLCNTFGPDWRKIMTREKIREMYLRM
jgi:3-deoxy-alpha-D-manno-octulosonate 8-oxidase